MNYTATFYLKSGAIVLHKIEFTNDANENDKKYALDAIENMIDEAIKKKSIGVISLYRTHINVQEIAAYTIQEKPE